MSENETFVTHDLGFAAFLRVHNFALLGAHREGTLFVFNFKDPQNAAPALRMEYVNSDFAKFDGEVKALKKLVSSVG